MYRTHVLGIAVMVLVAGATDAGAGDETEEFEATGVVVNVNSLYAKATKVKDGPASHKSVAASRVFITADGAYAFLETPANKTHLSDVDAGTTVQITGKLFRAGLLLQIDKLETVAKKLKIDLAKYTDATGEAVELKGTNKCQCALKVGALKHGCILGHLHHLQTADGKIYHYLQTNGGEKLFGGVNSHMRKATVTGRLFPGHFLLVESSEIK